MVELKDSVPDQFKNQKFCYVNLLVAVSAGFLFMNKVNHTKSITSTIFFIAVTTVWKFLMKRINFTINFIWWCLNVAFLWSNKFSSRIITIYWEFCAYLYAYYGLNLVRLVASGEKKSRQYFICSVNCLNVYLTYFTGQFIFLASSITSIRDLCDAAWSYWKHHLYTQLRVFC